MKLEDSEPLEVKESAAAATVAALTHDMICLKLVRWGCCKVLYRSEVILYVIYLST